MTEPLLEHPRPERPRPSRNRRIAAGVAVAVWVWAGVTVLLGALAYQERVCITCHSMRVYHAARSSTQHTSVSCPECHVSRRLADLPAEGLALERRLLRTLAGDKPSPLSPVSDRPCRSCHAEVLQSTVVSKGIAVSHKEFAEGGCLQCHGGVGHAARRRVYTTSRMDDCLTCHKARATNVEGCTFCHVEEYGARRAENTAWRVIHGPRWQQTHGAGDLHRCESCHTPEFCARCHGVSQPHPPTWPSAHGKYTLVEGTGDCTTCHDTAWCYDCHGTTMPHPVGFVAEHPDAATSVDDPTCDRCHDVRYCEACHAAAPHAWDPDADSPHTKVGEQ